VGCLRRIGCLTVIVLLVAGAWLTRDRWRPWLPAWMPGSTAARTTTAGLSATAWSPITEGGATRAERALTALGERGSPVFTTVRPGEFAAYMIMDVAGRLPPEADSAAAAVAGDQLMVRTTLDLEALGGRTALGPLASVVGSRAPLVLAGTFDVVRPGVAQFHVRQVTVRGIAVPGPLIPQLVHKVENGAHPAGLAPDALLLNVPPYLADIRVVRGRVTLYKNVP
jgi:hypothetical protein